MATLCCTNQTSGTLCFNLLRCMLAVKWLLVLVIGRVMLRKSGRKMDEITLISLYIFSILLSHIPQFRLTLF